MRPDCRQILKTNPATDVAGGPDMVAKRSDVAPKPNKTFVHNKTDRLWLLCALLLAFFGQTVHASGPIRELILCFYLLVP